MKQTVLTYLNRFIAFGGAVLALAVGLVPILTNADWTSTAGIVAGLAVAGGFVGTWLKGWQADEARKANEKLYFGPPTVVEPDNADGVGAV